jgi:hypothetical protein
MLADAAGRFEVWEAPAGAGTPVVWQDAGDLAWGYLGAQEEPALGSGWVRRLFQEPERARVLNGVFALLAVDRPRRQVLAIHDRLGVQGVYWAGGRVSTHLMRLLEDLRHDGAVDPERFLSHLAFGYTSRPVYRGVEKLGPASWAVVGWEDVKEGTYWCAPEPGEEEPDEKRLDELGEALRAAAPRQAVLGATAGKDSLVLAAAMAGAPPRWSGTFGAEACADRVQGREIGRRLGTKGIEAGVCRPEDFACWASHVAYHSAGLATASYVDMASFVGRALPPATPFVMGEGGECVRRFFGPNPVVRLVEQYMTPADCLAATTAIPVEGYPERLVQALREPMGPLDDDAFALRFYRSERMPGNFSQRHAALAPLRPKISPFLDTRFVEGAYGLSRSWRQDSRLHRVLVERLRPQFLDLFESPAPGTATTQEWETRFAGGVGAEVRGMLEVALPACRDVLCRDGVLRLCDETAARPSRALYHLFRVLSFARARQMLREPGC